MAIYDRPVRLLIQDMFAELAPQKGQTFSRKLAIEWFGKHYAKIKEGTISAHLIRFSTNRTPLGPTTSPKTERTCSFKSIKAASVSMTLQPIRRPFTRRQTLVDFGSRPRLRRHASLHTRAIFGIF